MAAMNKGKCVKYLMHAVLALLIFFRVDSIRASEDLTVYAPPSIWVNEEKGHLTGPVIDLVNEIFTELNINVTPTPLSWARAITQMKSGKLDMIAVIFYTEERAEFMEFSVPFAVVPTSVFVPAGKSFPYNSLADLTNKNGLIMRGDSISPEFEAYKGNLQLNEIAGYDQMISMLADQRADFAVAAEYGFLIEAKKMQFDSKIEMLPQSIASRDLHFAISKQSPYVKYLPMINQKLKELGADGRLERLVDDAIDQAVRK